MKQATSLASPANPAGMADKLFQNEFPWQYFCATELITQIKLTPHEMFLCNRLAFASLNYMQEHPLHYTNEFAWKYVCVCAMDYIS